MESRYPVNQRIRDLIRYLGYVKDKTDKLNVDGFYKKFINPEGSSERLRTVVIDKFEVKTDLLVEIADKTRDRKGQKLNANWLLTGEGEMFLSKNGTPVGNTTDKAERLLLIRDEEVRLLNEEIDRLNKELQDCLSRIQE
jgi:hypothetical protein